MTTLDAILASIVADPVPVIPVQVGAVLIDEVGQLIKERPLALRQLLAEGLPGLSGGRSDFRHVKTPARI
jgi:hypothetical protein